MQSYKLRKTSETALFPIENELRLLRQESDRNWTSLVLKILSVLFSGIGTTLLCQDEYIPTLVKRIFTKLQINPGHFVLFASQAVLAIAVFMVTAFGAITIINWKNRIKDNKKNEIERENLAEYFHKITLNNIITGKSFTKKALTKLIDMQNKMSEYDQNRSADQREAKELQEKIKEIKREFCLYISEAIYYFSIAERQIEEKKIVEFGSRDKYLKYLKEIGVITLIESLLMYENAIDELQTLAVQLQQMDADIWNENPYEVVSILHCLEKTQNIKRRIMSWQADLNNTIKKCDK